MTSTSHLRQLARANETFSAQTLESVLIEQYAWQRAQVADLLRQLRKATEDDGATD